MTKVTRTKPRNEGKEKSAREGASKATCANCVHSFMMRIGSEIPKIRVCKWGPPQLVTQFGRNEQGGLVPLTVAQWPAVADNDWCDQFWDGIDEEEDVIGKYGADHVS